MKLEYVFQMYEELGELCVIVEWRCDSEKRLWRSYARISPNFPELDDIEEQGKLLDEIVVWKEQCEDAIKYAIAKYLPQNYHRAVQYLASENISLSVEME